MGRPKGDSDFNRLVGAKLEAARKSRGLTRPQFAEKLDITHQQLGKYDKGLNRISLQRFLQICGVLKINPWDVLEMEGIEFDKNEHGSVIHMSAWRKLPSDLQEYVTKLIVNINRSISDARALQDGK